jgi:hypothetical protein
MISNNLAVRITRRHCIYLSEDLVEVLSLGNQILMDLASEQGDAVPADLITKVLSGHR